MKYYISGKSNKYEFDVLKLGNCYKLTNNAGKTYNIIAEQIDLYRFFLLVNNEPLIAHVIRNGDIYTTHVHGRQFELVVDDEKSKALKKLLKKTDSSHKQNQVKSPMPGLIVKLFVEVGDSIKNGDTLLVLSAMKMENEIKSSSDGIVKSIHCSENSSVEKNELLIEFE